MTIGRFNNLIHNIPAGSKITIGPVEEHGASHKYFLREVMCGNGAEMIEAVEVDQHLTFSVERIYGIRCWIMRRVPQARRCR